jgi:hypothetical protein
VSNSQSILWYKFEIDFVYFHPTKGIFHIEIKTGKLNEASQQLIKNRNMLNRLFLALCEALNVIDGENLWSTIFKKSFVFRPSSKLKKTGDTGARIVRKYELTDALFEVGLPYFGHRNLLCIENRGK